MKTSTRVTSLFHCSIERAFKTPILGDATKFHTGYGFLPTVTHFTEDETWGKPDGYRLAQIEKSILFQSGVLAKDIVIKRDDNKYWKWEVNNFKQWQMGFEKFQGEWFVQDNKNGTIGIVYIYSLYSRNIFMYPFHWLFTKTIWNQYMKHVIQNVKLLAEGEAPFLYN